jgi:hypothetical protein
MNGFPEMNMHEINKQGLARIFVGNAYFNSN